MKIALARKAPPTTQYHHAHRLWRHAHFKSAEDALLNLSMRQRSFDSTLLLGRLITRDSPSKGAAYLESALTRASSTKQQATLLAHLGNAYVLGRDYKKGESRFRMAQSKTREPHTLSTIAYYRAASAFLEGKPDTSVRESLKLALESADSDIRAKSYLLEAGFQSRKEQYRQQIPNLLAAFRILKKQEEPLVEILAHTLQNMAVLVREIHEPTLAGLIEKELNALDWTDALSTQEFVVAKALGWWKALNGDYLNAFRLLKRSSSVAVEAQWRAVAKLDLSYLARCLDEPHWSRQELNEAAEIATHVTWKAESGEATVALLLLAELYAPLDTTLAVQFLGQFREVESNMSPSIIGKFDRRLRALADYTSAIVEWRLGNRAEAIALLRNVYDVYDSIDHDWRAGRAASDLALLTGDSVWVRRARQKLELYQNSWLYKTIPADLTSARSSPSLRRLTPAQRRVFDLIIAGMSNAEIAAELQRSEYTVKNHLKVIFEIFSVRSRAELTAHSRNFLRNLEIRA